MKALNIVAGSLALALGGSFLIALLAEIFFSREVAMVVVVPPVILLGMSSRRIVERLMGYTLYEALSEENKNE